MELERIFQLLDAGYTKDEITKMSAPEPQPDEALAEPTNNAPAENESNAAVTELTKQVATLANIVKDIQLNNAKSAQAEIDTKNTNTADNAIRSFFSK